MINWVKVGTDVAVGGGAGVVDQLVENWDMNREAERGTKIGLMSQGGTYYNYGVPLLAVVATATGFLKNEWAGRLLTAGSVLAGRKATWQFTKRGEEAVPRSNPWSRDHAAEQKRLAAQEAARRKALAQLDSGVNIPVVSGQTVLI